MIFRFREFKVYQDAKKFNSRLYKIASKFDRRFYFLSDQLMRAGLSILLNIAEGSAKGSDRDFNRYIQSALGSVSEVVAALEVCFDLGIVDRETFDYLLKDAGEIANQLGGFSKRLKSIKHS